MADNVLPLKKEEGQDTDFKEMIEQAKILPLPDRERWAKILTADFFPDKKEEIFEELGVTKAAKKITLLIDVSKISSQEIPEIKFILKPFLPEGGKMIISGRAGSFKTFFSLQLSLRVALGKTFLLTYQTEKAKVLYVEGETPLSSMAERLKRIAGDSLEEGQFFFWPAHGLNLDKDIDLKTLKERIAETQAKLVVLDPISRFWTGEENSNQAVNAFLSRLNTLIDDFGVSLILVHHHGKPDRENPNRIKESRGASAWMDWTDAEIGLIKRQKYNQTLLEANFLKVRHSFGPEPLTLQFDSTKFDFMALDEGAKAKDLALKVLTEDFEDWTPRQVIITIMNEYGVAQRTTDSALSQLVAEEKIDKRKSGKGVEYRCKK